MKLTLDEVLPKCKEVLKSCRIDDKSERYGDSLSFYLKNDFYFEECWNLDHSLAALILPRLIHFKENHIGIPGNLCEYDENGNITNKEDAETKWQNILDKMIYAFWEVILDRFLEIEDDIERENIENKVTEGLKLFGEHFRSLWD